MERLNNKKEFEYETTEFFIAETMEKDWKRRKEALKTLCPCKVKHYDPKIWDRIFEMVTDENELVREQVVHTLCDGSPKELEEEVITKLESLWNDPSEKVKKKVRKALNSYRRTGVWNVL